VRHEENDILQYSICFICEERVKVIIRKSIIKSF